MKAMIPHHSIAILTSERANIDDPSNPADAGADKAPELEGEQ